MAKAFSVVSWNCEHWKEGDPRNADRVGLLASQEADVIALYEVEGKEVWRSVMDGLPGYSFFITEGQNTQEILVGIGPDTTAFLTQKIEFQSRDAFMRPGALVTVRADGNDYSMLFLHLASMTDARGFGLRTDMTGRAFEFKGYLDEIAKGSANFMFMGDLNAMGLDYVYGKEGGSLLHDRVSAEHELAALGYRAGKAGMRVLSKTAEVTWRGEGKMRGNLDHVVASEQIAFEQNGGREVEVRGWPQLPEAEQEKWVGKFSDHALLYFEVSKAQ
jgi:endonuclease/exonuclease/phosphatase family metal-dependent hydrolase